MKKDFTIPVVVEFKHLDTQSYVNHTNIYTYFENAYIQFFMKEIKTGWTFSHMPILLKESVTRFFKPVTELCSLEAKLKVVQVRSKGVELRISLVDSLQPDIVYALGNRVLIHCDLTTGIPKNFPLRIFQKLKSYLPGDK